MDKILRMKIKKLTLTYLGLIVGGSLAAQISWLKSHLAEFVNTHPHYAILVTGGVMALTLLHSPQAVGILTEFVNSNDQEEKQQQLDTDGNAERTPK